MSRPVTRIYKDICLSFIAHPVTGDLPAKTGDAAVIGSVKNLVRLNFYEVPFHPEIGSGVLRSLFENFTVATVSTLQKKITLVIKNYEPRFSLTGVQVVQTGVNGIQINISGYILNNVSPTLIPIFLERVR